MILEANGSAHLLKVSQLGHDARGQGSARLDIAFGQSDERDRCSPVLLSCRSELDRVGRP